MLSPKARRVFPLIEVRDQNSLQITLLRAILSDVGD